MTRGRSPRMRRVNELLREIIAEELSGLTDPRVGFVTVTGVETSPDLRNATVFYSVLGTEEEETATASGLTAAAPRLQAVMASQVRLKYTPRLAFHRDAAIEHGARITQILHDLEGHSTEEDAAPSEEVADDS